MRIDDLLQAFPQIVAPRPAGGKTPQLSDAELVTLAVMQALRGFTSERRWIRHAQAHLRHLFPYLPGQSGYNKRLRAASCLVTYMIRALGRDTAAWSDLWVVDSTPVECGRSRETVKRSDLAGWAQYGYCASHSRYFLGLRLHLVCTLAGPPVTFVLVGAKAGDQETLLDIFAADPEPLAERPGQIVIGDKNYFGGDLQTQLGRTRAVLLRPARKGEPDRAGSTLFKPLRQTVESINQKGPTGPGTARRPHRQRRGRPRPPA